MAQLGIEHIPSYSPQARGRMERFYETWQGRLPQELRKAGITEMDQANAFIRQKMVPWHNRKLAVAPKETGSAFVPVGGADLEAILCVVEDRVVASDNTVSWRPPADKSQVLAPLPSGTTLSLRKLIPHA